MVPHSTLAQIPAQDMRVPATYKLNPALDTDADGIAVGLVSWHHGMKAGFVFAGLGTLAALATGAFPSHEGLRGQELGEGLYTYLKLSAVVLGVALGKRARQR